MDEERCLFAAEGYLQLEMPVEAIFEIEQLPAKARDSIRVSELKLAAEMMQKHWSCGAEMAIKLCKMDPTKNVYFIHAAYCLHEKGETALAKNILRSGPKNLKKDALFHYNMACYSAVLGNKNEARSYLRSALELNPELEQTALKDKDLEGVDFPIG